ncbi:GNAT family N-acetyltransferase [Nonomuraea sediminis]|uniref:GNAT family N-acetyltransferase n=1 Tax=Nonomuraea sediminis TaxID=2835864 RepID=UPI001BDD1C97|nr:GNAT family N-acetyltransferase [Nonomuraea sediminis]
MRDYDSLIDEAWPAFERERSRGWTFRYAGGVTKRANSVLPLGERGDVEAAEAFYAARGLPCAFSMGPGVAEELDAELESRAYGLVDPTLIMAGSPQGEPRHRVRVEDEPWDGWLDTWWSVDGRYADGLEAARRICTGVKARYAAVEEDGVALAVGRGVPQGDTVGIYCMATLPAARRRGLASSVLRALVRQAEQAYLVTTASNPAAQALYRSEGFEVRDRYHYRVK